MWTHFEFANGSNPYISKTDSDRKWMLNHYDCEQISENGFLVHGERKVKCKTYEDWKEFFRDLAIEWQYKFGNFSYSYGELADWGDFFTTYGKRYGLLTEFRENGIC